MEPWNEPGAKSTIRNTNAESEQIQKGYHTAAGDGEDISPDRPPEHSGGDCPADYLFIQHCRPDVCGADCRGRHGRAGGAGHCAAHHPDPLRLCKPRGAGRRAPGGHQAGRRKAGGCRPDFQLCQPPAASGHGHRAYHLFVCPGDCGAVRLPGQRCGLCSRLFENLRLRHDFCHARPGAEPLL